MNSRRVRIAAALAIISTSALTGAVATASGAARVLRPHGQDCQGYTTLTHVTSQTAWLPTNTHFPKLPQPPGSTYSVKSTTVWTVTDSLTEHIGVSVGYSKLISMNAGLTNTLTAKYSGSVTVDKSYTMPHNKGDYSSYVWVFREGKKVSGTYKVYGDRAINDKCPVTTYKVSWFSPLKSKHALFCPTYTDLISPNPEVVANNHNCHPEW